MPSINIILKIMELWQQVKSLRDIIRLRWNYAVTKIISKITNI